MKAPIIRSILDTDLYKLTMMCAIAQVFPRAKVRYTFINRGKTPFPEDFKYKVGREIKAMESLKLQPEEREFLEKKCKYLTPTFLDILENYRFDSSEIGIIQKDNVLEINIEGLWYKTVLWEVPLMALISELNFEHLRVFNYKKESLFESPDDKFIYDENKRHENNIKKINTFKMNGFNIADFGTRRRFSFEIQQEVIEDFIANGRGSFVGTSNVYLAYLYNLTPIGTHAHEWFMFHAAKYGYKQANHIALEHWVDVFRGDLGIALTDTFTTDAFFKSFDLKFAKLFDGVRHDSADPYIFGDKAINHYSKLRIDPMSKTIVFSDNLDTPKAIKIGEYFRNRIKFSFGIGTNLTNDVGVTPLNMVIKLAEAKLDDDDEWSKCIKLGDGEGKYTGDSTEIGYCKYALNLT